MNIGDAASKSNLPVKTVRYYDEIALVVAARLESGYRDYRPADVHRLRFVARARGLGFSIDDCRHLLSLYDDDSRASADVKAIVADKLREVDRKMEELQSIRSTLEHLSRHCRGDDCPECPILDDLAGTRASDECRLAPG